jgi:hypothetical protein
MSINFAINTQVNDLAASIDQLPDDATIDLVPVLREILKILDPHYTLEQPGPFPSRWMFFQARPFTH